MQASSIPLVETNVTTNALPKPARKPHIYELDPLRAITAIFVIAVHVLFFTKLLGSSSRFRLVHYGLLDLTHFTRSVFMFVTAFAMVYVYYGKNFSWASFWKKRSIGVLLPYVFWSCLYVLYNWHPATPAIFVNQSLLALVEGSASYQLYYILLTLQLYIILPLFLLFLRAVKNHPWITIGISFVLEMVMMYVDYHYYQPGGAIQLTGFWQQFIALQDRYLFLYQFYFVLGGIAALYQQQVRDFLGRHGKLIVIGFIASVVIMVGHYYLQMRVWNEASDMNRVTSVSQPAVVVYSLGVIAFSGWLAYHWAQRLQPNGLPRWYPFIQTLSNASFGVYLIHAFFISYAMQSIVPILPSAWPAEFRAFLIYDFVAICAVSSSIILMKIPVVSRLVGRKQPWPKWATRKQRYYS